MPLKILKNKYLLFILALMAVTMAAATVFRGRITTYDVTWACDQTACKVNFSVKNSTHGSEVFQCVIRAYRKRSMGHGAVVTDLVGEKSFDIQMYTGENRSFDEILPLSAKSRVDLVSVSTFKPRNN